MSKKVIIGSSISNGFSIGKIAYINPSNVVYQSIIPKPSKNAEKEFVRFRSAGLLAAKELRELYDACVSKNETAAGIFMAHQMLIKDKSLEDRIHGLIVDEGMSAEAAVKSVRDDMVNRLSSVGDEIFIERAADVSEVADRILRILSGAAESTYEINEPSIVIADEMTASLIVALNNRNLKGIVTNRGSKLSHVAIIARSVGIPAITGVNIDPSWNGLDACLESDAPSDTGVLTLNPDKSVLEQVNAKLEALKEKSKELAKLVDIVPIHSSGKSIMVNANISSASEVLIAEKNGANGIGLFRTEFIYLRSNDYPDEEIQFEIYKNIAVKMKGKETVIRTMDVGADKDVEYLKLPKEENPAMGYRGIRVSLDRPQVFKTQLRAILRASEYGNLSVLYPMITSCREVIRAHEILKEVKAELKERKIPFKNIKEGAMIETPAAALDSMNIAQYVDFFSIGTNDLMQYTYAVDRSNNALFTIYEDSIDAIMKLIKMSVDSAHDNNIKVSVCGEMAADSKYIDALIKMGVDELSVAPLQILNTKGVVIG